MKTGKFKGFLRKVGIGSLVAIVLIGLAHRAKAYFELTYAPSNDWIDFYSSNSEVDPNDEAGIFVEGNDPNIGKICIGKYVVKDPNKYGFLHAYWNDPYTPEKDGADHNDLLEFRIWKASEMKEYFAITNPNQVIFDYNKLKARINVNLSKGNRVPYTLKNLSDFVSWWLADCNDINNNCAWWDINKDGIINFKDYVDFADNYRGD